MSRVLILTAAYGEGHNAAARGLLGAFHELGAEAEIADSFARTAGAAYDPSRRAYVELINRAPKIWAAIYRAIDKLPTGTLALPLLGAVYRDVQRLLECAPLRAVISVYPLYGYCLAHLGRRVQSVPFYTVVTDSITINSIWHRCPLGTFLVPNEESAAVMAQARVAPHRVRTTGFPVATRFARDRPVRSGPPCRVLYMVNAGRDRAPEIVRRLLGLSGVQLTVTVGRDEELGRRLQVIAAECARPLELYGWTSRMPELLMTHHLLIGKAGGATVQETIAARTPMLLTQVVPGQEEGNAQLLLDNSCGALCETPEALAGAIARLFANHGAAWFEWERNITRLSRPDAALRIAEMVLAESAQPSTSVFG